MRKTSAFLLLSIAILTAFALACSVGADPAELRLAHIFGDNMVLQSGPVTPVWGWATPGQKVTVTVGAQSASGIADANGKWTATLKGLKRSDVPVTVTVKADKTITLQNVLIGDVWLGSGQSNMEFPIQEITNAKEEMAKANYPNIRLFTVPRMMKNQSAEDCQGKWVVCSPESLNGFSAVLYLFGREIADKTKMPLGLIHSSFGGTRIELWTAPEGFESIPEFVHYADSIKSTEAAYRSGLSERLTPVEDWIKSARQALAENKPIPIAPDWPDHPGAEGGAACLYGGMINPIVPFALRGFVWYQGEWNGGEDDIYVKRMQALISGWRKAWHNDKLPFYYVQLARMPEKDHSPWLANGLTPTREAQLKSLSIPYTGMASIIDLEGDSGWHPRNKQDPAKRLALWALKNEYGFKSLVVSGPLYKSMAIEGDKIRISFDYTGSGLIVGSKNGLDPVQELSNGTLGSFAIAGADRKWFAANAVIEGKTVVVSSPDVPAPAAVRYGYCNDPDNCSLYNKECLPASPFRTDDW